MIDVRAEHEKQRQWAAKNAARLQQKRLHRMTVVDEMPKELRELVHNYGLNVVVAFLDAGVGTPRHIRHLVETVLDEFSPTRGSSSAQGQSNLREWAET